MPFSNAHRVVVRVFVLALAAVAATVVISGATGAPSQRPLQKVTHMLDFFANATDAGYYVAVDKGYYAAEGLDVDIVEGAGSARTAQAIASGQVEFGTVAAPAHTQAAALGAPIKMVGMIFGEDGSGVITKTEIRTPKDLEGKTVVASLGLLIPMFQGYLRNAGVDPGKVRVVTVAPAAVTATFLAGQSDGFLGFALSTIPVRLAGHKVNFLPFKAQGLTTLGQGIVANTKTIGSNPDLVRRYVRASLRGWRVAYDNPRYAIGVMQRMVPAAVQASIFSGASNLAQLKAQKNIFYTKRSKGKPFGWSALADWQTMLRNLVDAKVLTGDVPQAQSLFTNEFIPARLFPKPRR